MDSIVAVVKLARYNNMYKMLGDTFDEEMYLKIVENKILVDIQAPTLLLGTVPTPAQCTVHSHHAAKIPAATSRSMCR